jgi:hypothetical protein
MAGALVLKLDDSNLGLSSIFSFMVAVAIVLVSLSLKPSREIKMQSFSEASSPHSLSYLVSLFRFTMLF